MNYNDATQQLRALITRKMTLNRRLLALQVLISATGLATPGIAFAYMDPGTVSLLIQGLIGAIAAAGAAVSLWWNNIRSFFDRLKNKGNAKPLNPENSDNDHASNK